MSQNRKPHHLANGRALRNAAVAARNSHNIAPTRPVARGAQIIRLPIFQDGVFVGNEFIPISSRLRARIRAMAKECRK